MLHTTISVITICAPLFALILFGALVRRSGMLTADAQRFITWLVYTFSLPVLVFVGICKQDFRSLLNASVVGSTLAAFVLVLLIAWAASLLLPAKLRGSMMTAAFLANLSYMGFPLANNAYGPAGLTYAGIVNAFSMPVLTVATCLLLAMGRPGNGSISRQMRAVAVNPVILAALAGVACAFLAHETAWGRAVVAWSPAFTVLKIGDAVLQPIAALGLPLSLVAVGAALRFGHVREYRLAIAVSGVLKLVVAPLLTLVLCRLIFPSADPAAVGTAVLLMACPLAVAGYVLGEQLGAETGFLASDLAVTTAASCVTIPIWVAILL
jgi:predicted permease